MTVGNTAKRTINCQNICEKRLWSKNEVDKMLKQKPQIRTIFIVFQKNLFLETSTL